MVSGCKEIGGLIRKFFGRTKIASEKNGEIVISYFFGRTRVFVNGFDQSTGYTDKMWRRAFRHLSPEFIPKNILMLGLGGGSAVQVARKRFPDCKITVVEWDPFMIKIYEEIHGGEEPIRIIEGDAAVIVPEMTEKFDLIIVDLFKGKVTPVELASDQMVEAIARILAPGGHCLLNAFVSLELIPVFAEHFLEIDAWRYKYNQLLLYAVKIN